MIKSNGKRINPEKIENILCSINGIAESAVIGVPDEVFGQAIKAYIIKHYGDDIDPISISQYCSKNMEAFMIPRYIEFVNEMPKNSNGKVDKKALVSK